MARNIILTEMDKFSKEFKEILEFFNKNILLRDSYGKL